jgi:hypothetical protein
LREAGETLRRELRAIELALVQGRTDSPLRFASSLAMRLAALSGFGEGADAPPTEGMSGVYEELSGLMEGQIGRLRSLFERDLSKFNELVREEQVPPIPIPEL